MKTAPPPLVVERTDGVRLYLADGRELIDGIASWWTACHGYNHPHIREGVAAQLERMPHVMLGGLAHAPATVLASRLAALLPGDLDHVFFTESGSVSVEVAMKIAVQYRFNRGEQERTRVWRYVRRDVGLRSRRGNAPTLRGRAAEADRRAAAA